MHEPEATLKPAGSRLRLICMATAVTALIAVWSPRLAVGEDDPVRRGERLFRASGGCGCHMGVEAEPQPDALDLGGGRPIETPFGSFHATNISPDVETGLGQWSVDDFIRAMQHGRAPDGSAYYPVFPYPAFTGMSDADLRDLWAYLRSVPAVRRSDRPHELKFPYSMRVSATMWQLLFFSSERYRAPAGLSPEEARGGYLTNSVGHCQECHTPRTAFGTLDLSMYLAGAAETPDGELAPNITADNSTGIGEWTPQDITWLLRTGFKPDGDDLQGVMAELIEVGYSRMPREDRGAIAAYLGTVKPVVHRVSRPDASAQD